MNHGRGAKAAAARAAKLNVEGAPLGFGCHGGARGRRRHARAGSTETMRCRQVTSDDFHSLATQDRLELPYRLRQGLLPLASVMGGSVEPNDP
jgi:hypothetical protein